MSKDGFTTVLLPIEKLVPMKFQSRISKEDPEKFKELVESIKENGVLEPILARPLHDNEGRYETVAGERRRRAAKQAGLEMVPVHVKDGLSDEKAILYQLEENLHRDDYTDEDKTHALAELAKLKGWKAKEIAENIHKSYSFVLKYLPEEFKDQQKAQAGALGGEAKAVATQRVPEIPPIKRQDITRLDIALGRDATKPANLATPTIKVRPNGLVECEIGMHLVDPSKARNVLGHTVCVAHAEVAKIRFKPELETETKEFKPEETWTQRKAQMTPQHSKMELELLEMFSNDELLRPVQTERSFTLVSVTPDFVFPRLNMAVFLDGKEAHQNRQDRDEKLREQLEKYHHLKVLSITYDSNSKKEKQRIFKTVKDAT